MISTGGPAVFSKTRPVVFRPYLAVGLALSINAKNMYPQHE